MGLPNDYFSKINTHEKAYLLGYIWADGYISKRVRNINHVEYSLKLICSEKDTEHLINIKKYLNIKNNIKTFEVKTGFKKTNGESCFASKLCIYNSKLFKFVYDELGIFPNRKCIKKIITNIDEKYHNSFILGFFDGDGTVIKNKNKYSGEFSIGFIGSPCILSFINTFINKNNLSKTNYIKTVRHIGRDNGMKNIRITGNLKVYNILKFLYKDSKLFLNRKNLLFLELSDIIKNKYGDDVI